MTAVFLCFSISGCQGLSSTSDDDICKIVADIPADTVLLTIDGRKVTAEEYLYWTCLVLDTYYYYHEAGSDTADETCSWVSENWDNGLSSTVLGYLMNYNAPIIHAQEMGFAVDQAEMDEAVDMLVSDYRAGYADDETFELYLSQLCISPAGFRHVMEENVYYQCLFDYLYHDGGEYAPSDEDLLAFADNNGYYACKYAFFSTVGCYTDEARDQMCDKAQLLLNNIAQSDDPDVYFSTVIMDPNWNDDTDESEDGLLSTGGTISAVFDEAVRSLAVGEFSGIVDNTDEYGYFVIQRLPVPLEEVRDACCASLFNQLISQWNADADVEFTDAYDRLNIQNFYVSLINYRLSTDLDAQETE